MPVPVVSRCSKRRHNNARLNLLNDLVCDGEQRGWDSKAEHIRGLAVEHQLELSRLHDR